MSRALRRVLAGGAVLAGVTALALGGCPLPRDAARSGTVYRLRPAPESAPLAASGASTGDPEPARRTVERAEARCRGALVQTVAATRAIEGLREALQGVCEVAPVDGNPFWWRFACRADALFNPGSYCLQNRSVECGAGGASGGDGGARGGGARTDPWACAGALLRQAMRTGEIVDMEIDALGHADRIDFRGQFDACAALRSYFGEAEVWQPFVPPPSGASDPQEAVNANNRLAWCRAAGVVERMLRGSDWAGAGGAPPVYQCSAGTAAQSLGRAPDRPARYSVSGMSTALQDQQRVACAPTSSSAGDCPAARRVDVFIRLTPRVDQNALACSAGDRGAAGSLYCFQDCRRSAVRRTGASEQPAGPAPARANAPACWHCAGNQGRCDDRLVDLALRLGVAADRPCTNSLERAGSSR